MTHLIAFFDEMTDAVDKKWMFFSWVLAKAFEMVILILKRVSYKLDVEMSGKLAGLLRWKKKLSAAQSPIDSKLVVGVQKGDNAIQWLY